LRKLITACLILTGGVFVAGCRPDGNREGTAGADGTAANAGSPASPTAEKVPPGSPLTLGVKGSAARLVDVDPLADVSLPSPAATLAKARQQWPEDGKERAQALADRVDQISAAVNAACGTDIRILLNETGRGGMATGEGVVYLDFSMVWRLSEDALAVLVAHEFAHEVLGHAEQLNRLHRQGTGNRSYVQQVRGLEERADEYAGRILARTGHDPAGFRELLALGHDTEWADPLLRSYYPNRERIKTVMESYQAERAGQE